MGYIILFLTNYKKYDTIIIVMYMKNSTKLFLFIFILIFMTFIYITYNKQDNTSININTEKYDGLKISYLNVGQADAILIETKNNNILVDAGNTNDGNLLVDYLKKMKIDKFAYVIGTHAHEDHIGGMAKVIDNFDIDTFYMPNVMTTTKCFEDLLDSLLEKRIKLSTPNIGDEFDVDEAHIKILYTGEDSDNLNNSSIVFKLTYGEVSFLFTGDATTKVEKEIINEDLKSNVLKVGHHGSKTSSSNSFINKVDPDYAIISVGKNNKYNLPSKVIIERLNKKGIKVYQTSEDGTIIITSNGKEIGVETIDVILDGG